MTVKLENWNLLYVFRLVEKAIKDGEEQFDRTGVPLDRRMHLENMKKLHQELRCGIEEEFPFMRGRV